ncbi:MAG: hypothetical protein MZV64_32995 [Ignavibacteriales bacterium]|nr:hypothetical protein [Ignavibacteriales bacterium]
MPRFAHRQPARVEARFTLTAAAFTPTPRSPLPPIPPYRNPKIRQPRLQQYRWSPWSQARGRDPGGTLRQPHLRCRS